MSFDITNYDLIVMIGPSGAGKSTWISDNVNDLSSIICPDNIREELLGDFKDQSKNKEVFEEAHNRVRHRLQKGLQVVFDATNLSAWARRSITDLTQPGQSIAYVVIDRPLKEKLATGGWRNEVIFPSGETLVENHHRKMKKDLRNILAGDMLPNVTVFDCRTIL